MIHYGSITGPTQAAHCLRLLRAAGGNRVSAYALAEQVGTLALHSVIAEIRPQIAPFAERIENEVEVRVEDGRRRTRSWYRLVADGGKQMEMGI